MGDITDDITIGEEFNGGEADDHGLPVFRMPSRVPAILAWRILSGTFQ